MSECGAKSYKTTLLMSRREGGKLKPDIMSTDGRRSSVNSTNIREILSSQVSAESAIHQQALKKKPLMTSPQIVENQVGESIDFRTNKMAGNQDLGPADLIHITKYNRHDKTEVGEYHYCVGLDTSSIIQPFMYLQTLLLNNKHTATEKHPKVGTYCTYNCFRKGDLRIRYTFPGTAAPTIQFVPSDPLESPIDIDTEDIDSPKSLLLWKETYACSLVRALCFSDDIERQLPGMVKLNPVQSTKDAKEAIVTLCQMIPRGYMLGCDDLYNQPSLHNNRLVDALRSLLKVVGYYDLVLAQIERLQANHPKRDFTVLVARILLDNDKQSQAIRLIHDTLVKSPRHGWMLQLQASFLLTRNRPDLALIPASRSIECLPTEFICWQTMIKAYIMKKDYRNALLSLNSSPMYSNKKKDIYAALPPKSFQFPLPTEGCLPQVWDNCEMFGCISGVGNIVEFSPTGAIETVSKKHLQVFQQTKLQCTYKQAYNILAVLTKHVGWSELLQLRSELFVMEDEYNASMEAEQQRECKKHQAIQRQNEDPALLQKLQKKRGEVAAEDDDRRRSVSSVRTLSRVSTRFRKKRLSERWLDSLFLILYENLRSVLLWENEQSGGEEVGHSALEWELIGNECMDVLHYESGLVPLETALSSRFSIFDCHTLLNYYLYYTESETEFLKMGNIRSKESQAKKWFWLSDDFILLLLAKLISWNYRWYGEFSLLTFRVLKSLSQLPDNNLELIKNKIDLLYNRFDEQTAKIERHRHHTDMPATLAPVIDRYLSWLEQFDHDEIE